jgi:hypothetical protein
LAIFMALSIAAEPHRGKVGVARRGDIGELPRLLGHRFPDLGAAVADIDDVEPGKPVDIGAALRIVEPAALAAHHDPEPVALGEVEPARAVNPDMVERPLFNRRELAHHPRVVCHIKSPCALGDQRSAASTSIPHTTRVRSDLK